MALGRRTPCLWPAMAWLGGWVPGVVAQEPRAGDRLPESRDRLPSEGSVKPCFGESIPSFGGSIPSEGFRLPWLGNLIPSEGFRLPWLGNLIPSEGSRLPSEGFRLPWLGDWMPRKGPEVSCFGRSIPSEGSRFPSEGFRLPWLGDWMPRKGPEVSCFGRSIPSEGSARPEGGSSISSRGWGRPSQRALKPSRSLRHPATGQTRVHAWSQTPHDKSASPRARRPAIRTCARRRDRATLTRMPGLVIPRKHATHSLDPRLLSIRSVPPTAFRTLTKNRHPQVRFFVPKRRISNRARTVSLRATNGSQNPPGALRAGPPSERRSKSCLPSYRNRPGRLP